MTTLKLGTRGSALALTQSRWVASQIETHNEGVKVELVVIKTSGDRDQNSALNKFAGKGIFTKEIEDALLAKEIDLAVHSLKDLPTTLPPGLTLADPPKREDPRDLLVASVALRELPEGAVVGTGSARRREQLRLIRPDLKFAEIRGNVATRVNKWRQGQYGATVLACAGVARLGPEEAGLKQGESHPLSYQDCLPAPAQGILGIEIRENDPAVQQILAQIACGETTAVAAAERSFLAELDGGCHIPAGALAQIQGETMTITGFLAVEDSTGGFQGKRATLSGEVKAAESLGREVARVLKKQG